MEVTDPLNLLTRLKAKEIQKTQEALVTNLKNVPADQLSEERIQSLLVEMIIERLWRKFLL